MTAIALSRLASSGRWQQDFFHVLPAVEKHASISLRWLAPQQRAEAAAEAIAAAFVSYGALARQRKLSGVYRSSLAHFAVRSVQQFRHVGGHQSCRDVMSGLAQKLGRATVCSLTPWDHATGSWREVAVESKRVSPADTAAFRIDFQQWLRGWPDRHRQIIAALASGERTMSVAERFGVTEGRVSQLRRRYEHSWQVFQGMVPDSIAA